MYENRSNWAWSQVKLHASANNEQLYDSDTDLYTLDHRMQREVPKVNTRYTENGIIVNLSKHHAIEMGSTPVLFYHLRLAWSPENDYR